MTQLLKPTARAASVMVLPSLSKGGRRVETDVVKVSMHGISHDLPNFSFSFRSLMPTSLVGRVMVQSRP